MLAEDTDHFSQVASEMDMSTKKKKKKKVDEVDSQQIPKRGSFVLICRENDSFLLQTHFPPQAFEN